MEQASPRFKIWHRLRARPRLVTSVAVGLATFLLLPLTLAISTRLLAAWIMGAGLYLILAWLMFARSTVDHMRWRARLQDDGAAAVLSLTVVAALASLAAIILELSGLKAYSLLRQSVHLGLAAGTFISSWLVVHTAFALHYANAYYLMLGKEGHAPLAFPDQDAPVYMDFLYFAIVIGMTSQTADVAIASTRMRRLVMAHGLIAFIFNTSLLALTINIAASLLG